MSQTGNSLTAPKDAALKDKVIIVTGASRGIGHAISVRLAREGAKLVLAARDEKALAEAATEVASAGGAATPFAADLRGPAAQDALTAAAVRAYGGIDAVVNNAGATRRGDFLALSDDDWADGFALKFFGAVRLVRSAWPQLKQRRGAVLNIIGVGGRAPGADFTIGGSVNGAFITFTKALADVGVRDGVRVNAINPGYVRTQRLLAWVEKDARQRGITVQEVEQEAVRSSGVLRMGEPEDIANLAAFVLSAEGSLLHGAILDMDSGRIKTV